MKTAVIYHSQTGFTKRYAQWTAEAVKADCFELSEAREKDLSGYEAVYAAVDSQTVARAADVYAAG